MKPHMATERDVQLRIAQELGLSALPIVESTDAAVMDLLDKSRDIIKSGVTKDSREFNMAVAYYLAAAGIVGAWFI